MKRLLLPMVVLGLLGTGGPAGAAHRPAQGLCDTGPRLASTLLLPYFEVDTNNPKGVNTVFSIGNSTVFATLVHVTIWSDLAVPVLNFDVYLTGHDIELVDLGQIIHTGVLPRTASDGQDPADTISPQGTFSQDINFASCNGLLPPANLTPAVINHLKRSLTGQSSPLLGNLCAGRALGDGIARGYVTVDMVTACSSLYPSDPGYFLAIATVFGSNLNNLFGDYTLIEPKGQDRGTASNTLVHIEANATDPETSTAGEYTFYGRYVGWAATDHREPLATTFAVRYEDGSDIVVWRDSKVAQQAVPCPAGPGNPSWVPLEHELLAIFDLEENLTSIPAAAAPFPVATQRVTVGSADLPAPTPEGWIHLSLNTAVAAAGPNPPEDPDADQGFVTVIHRGDKHGFISGHDATPWDSACDAYHPDFIPEP